MNTRLATIAMLSTLAVLTAAPAAAESDCKGLTENACGAAGACSWVKGYTRKDGREVAPYCRAKTPGKAAAQPTDKTAPAG